MNYLDVKISILIKILGQTDFYATFAIYTERANKMTKNKGYKLVFTNSDIQQIAKNSTAEVAAKQLVTARDEFRSSTVVSQKGSSGSALREARSRYSVGISSSQAKQAKAYAGSVLSQGHSEYSSKQAVDMFNVAFKKARS